MVSSWAFPKSRDASASAASSQSRAEASGLAAAVVAAVSMEKDFVKQLHKLQWQKKITGGGGGKGTETMEKKLN